MDGWFDRDGSNSIVEVLTEMLAAAEGVDVTDLPPLYDAVDIEALERLFERYDDSSGCPPILGFEYGDWNVFVRGDGRVRVCDGTQIAETVPVFSGEPV
jgi:hypothetical protein